MQDSGKKHQTTDTLKGRKRELPQRLSGFDHLLKWVKDPVLLQAVAQVVDTAPTQHCSGYSFDSTPSLGTSICHRCSHKKKKKKKEKEISDQKLLI